MSAAARRAARTAVAGQTGNLRRALEVWQARAGRDIGERAYRAYMWVLAVLILCAPMARMLWLGLTSDAGIDLLESVRSGHGIIWGVGAVWLAAFGVGSLRGPAMRPPFLVYALGGGPASRTQVFGGPVVRSLATVSGVVGAVVLAGYSALCAAGLASVSEVIVAAVAGVFVGMIAGTLWLAGQVSQGWMRVAAIAVPAVTLVVVAVWLRFGPVVVTGGGDTLSAGQGIPKLLGIVPVTVVGALAALCLGVIPVLLNQLSLPKVLAQSQRWQSAVRSTQLLDLSQSAATYQGAPRWFRKVPAVSRSGGLGLVFFRRSAVGLVRAPGRTMWGLLCLLAAAALIGLSLSTPAGWVVGAATALLTFVGVGPFTDGLRHAASVALSGTMYGISDEKLVALHLFFPLAVILLVLGVGALCVGLIVGTGNPVTTVIAAAITGIIAVLARVNNALKGFMPARLYVPVITPMGDLSALNRVLWAIDAVLLVAVGGIAVALLPTTPVPLLAVFAVLLLVGARRWRAR